MYRYDPLDKTEKWDATPLAFVLRVTKTHVLALNFHWMPIPLRKIFLKQMFKLNKNNIKENKPLEYTWKHAKKLLNNTTYEPVIRLYIRKRMSKRCVVIPNEHINQIILTKTETFLGVSADELYKLAKLKKQRKSLSKKRSSSSKGRSSVKRSKNSKSKKTAKSKVTRKSRVTETSQTTKTTKTTKPNR